MAKEIVSPPSPCLDSDPEDVPLAAAYSKPPALERSEASVAAPAEGTGGAAQQGCPGLPRGVEFNPSDGDLLWHLAAEVGNGQARRHPFISEFIKSVDETIGFGCTHPQDIPGIRQDGYAAYFFHKNFKVCNNGNGNYISWQKVGNPISIILDGDLQGFKEVFILYAYETDGNSPQITDWRLHQYHITSTDKDEGELVVSKIFYKSEKNQFKWAEKSHAQSAQDASTTNDESREELQLENHSSNMVNESSFAQGNENKQKEMQIETCPPDQNKINCFNVLDNMRIGNKINDHDEIEELDHMSLQERYRILWAEKHSCSAAVSSEQCAIDGLENSCRPETNGLIPKRNHLGTAFRDSTDTMLQEISSAPPIIDSISNYNNRRLLAEGLSNNQQSHEAGCVPGFLSMSSLAAPSQCQVGCSHDLPVNGNTIIYSGKASSSLTPTFGDESIPLKGTNDRTFSVDIKLEPALEGDLAEKITSFMHSTDPKHVTEGSSLVVSINSVSSEISKRISEAARCKLESSHVEGLLPSLGIKNEVIWSELPQIVCGLTSINIAELTGRKTNTLNHDGSLAYCSSKRKRKTVKDPSEKALEEDSHTNDEGTAYFSRQRRRRKTATDSIEKALEEDAPGLLQILLDRGILANEIKLYGVEEDDDMVLDCTESDFQDLENVISKLFPQRTSLLKSAIRHEKGERAIYCLTCLISLIEQSRYLQFRDCPVEWGWCRDLQSFIFVFKSHNRIVLERPEYGYATYFFEIVKSLPIKWQIQRLVTAMKLSGCGRTALIENRPLLIGEDLTEGEARVLQEYGWLPNSGLGTMLNYRDRVVHDRWNEKSGTDWRTKIGKLLMNGYSEGHLILSHFPTKVGKLEDNEVKQEDPF